MLIFFNPELVSPISNIIWYRYRPILTERKLQSCIIKGYLPNKGYATLVRKFESVQDWVIICKNTAETLIALWHRRYAKIMLDKNSFIAHLLWLPWHFELDVWPVSESGTEIMLTSDSSSESSRPPRWVFVAGKGPGLLFSLKYSTP